MADQPLCILQVSTLDIGGGAEKVAWNLFQTYRQRGYGSWLAVGYKLSDDPNIFLVPNDGCRNCWTRTWIAASNMLSPLVGVVRGAGLLRSWINWIGQPKRLLEILRGREDFDFPGTWQVLHLPPTRPDILHCHNLHRNYLDLRSLPWLSHQIPVLLTLQDAWLLSGHCAHSFNCEKWKTGCGQCPDLTIYPAIRRDATAYNWGRKKEIYAHSRFYIATPCHWLMDKVKQSILMEGALECRVIPNGVDLRIFHPGDRLEARRKLGLPSDALIVLFVSHGIRSNPWRDYQLLEVTIKRLSQLEEIAHPIIMLCCGETGKPQRFGQVEIRFVPWQDKALEIVDYYQAADVYLHPAKADTFPNVVLEAQACGTPVVATTVGGISEQVQEGVTGFLVPPGDSEAMAARIQHLLSNNDLRRSLSIKAAESAHQRFDLEKQVDNYLSWYSEILHDDDLKNCPDI